MGDVYVEGKLGEFLGGTSARSGGSSHFARGLQEGQASEYLLRLRKDNRGCLRTGKMRGKKPAEESDASGGRVGRARFS